MAIGNTIGAPFPQRIGKSIYNILPDDNIVLHIDASDSSTLWQAQNGTNPATDHNDYVRRVDNKAFLHQAAYGTTSTNPFGKFYISLADSDAGSPRLTMNASGANGYTALYFGGSAQGLYCSMASLAEGAVYDPTGSLSGYSDESPGSAFLQTWIVVKGTASVSSEETVFCEAMKTSAACGGSNTERSININGSDSQWEENLNGTVKDSTVASTSNFELWTFKNNTTSVCTNCSGLYRNGDTSDGVLNLAMVNVAQYRRVLGTNQDCTALSIGCHTNNDASTFSKHWDGYIFEMVAAVVNITDAQRTAMDNYFLNKYNIS